MQLAFGFAARREGFEAGQRIARFKVTGVGAVPDPLVSDPA
jgi:hypothetical protein